MKERPILKSKLYLYLTEFFAGVSVMAVELGASRLLAPYFSSSQIVWTIIIGTIMIAMNRASQMGYLKDNGKVKLNISSKSSTWVSDMETDLSKSMDDGVSGKDVTIFLYLNGGKTPDMVIVTGSGSPKTYSYADWQTAQTAKSSGGTQSAQTPGSIEQWGENQGDAWEQWGEEQGDSWKSFGNDVEDIFDDGFSGGNDVRSLIDRLKDQLG